MKSFILKILGKFTGILKRKRLLFIIFFAVVIFFIGKSFLFPQEQQINSTTVKKGTLQEELTLSGKIDADEHAVLQFQTAGLISWVGVKEGDWVEKNQPIASLEKEKLEAVLRQTQQDFIAAKAEHDKYYDGRGDSESYDEKIERTALDAKQNKAYDSLRIAQENLKDAVLYSPINGLVIKVDPTQGTIISSPTQGQIEIINPNTIFFSVTADQTEVVSLKKGQKAEIIFDSYPDETTTGIINSISFNPKKDESGTVYEVKINLDNANNGNDKYRLGMTGDANFITKQIKNALYLPLDFVKSDDKGKYVFSSKEKKKTYVITGIETETDVEIVSGLREGDQVYD